MRGRLPGLGDLVARKLAEDVYEPAEDTLAARRSGRRRGCGALPHSSASRTEAGLACEPPPRACSPRADSTSGR